MGQTLADIRDRIRTRVVGRERELDLLLAAVAAGRDILLEGPPGTSKSTSGSGSHRRRWWSQWCGYQRAG